MENSGTTWAHTGATETRDACLTEKSVDSCGWRRRGDKKSLHKNKVKANRGVRERVIVVATRQTSESKEEKG